MLLTVGLIVGMWDMVALAKEGQRLQITAAEVKGRISSPLTQRSVKQLLRKAQKQSARNGKQ